MSDLSPPNREQQRIHAQQKCTRVLALWRSLQSLRSTVSFMNSGAHPDDETSSMLAALSLRDGMTVSYACANRGEGGQNNIGTETTENLGVLRTAEMEQAAKVLGMKLYWLSQDPSDSIFDFGFSKSGEQTLQKWQHERTLQRLVDIVRTERPDILCPTFLDVPGQHGHHRAMTQIAHEVFDAAADENFISICEHARTAGTWQIKKLYLPAWSGAGDSYDDDFPPPPMTLMVDANGEEAPSGWSWAQIGQHSRAFHQSQGMGKWVALNVNNQWPLHLKRSRVDGPDESLNSGIAANFTQLAAKIQQDFSDFSNTQTLIEALENSARFCEQAIANWPTFPAVLESAFNALEHLRVAQQQTPDALRKELEHRLARKEIQLANVIRLASGAEARVQIDKSCVAPDDSFNYCIESKNIVDSVYGQINDLQFHTDLDLPENWRARKQQVTVHQSAQPSNGYRDFYDPLAASTPALRLSIIRNGVPARSLIPLEDEIIVAAKYHAKLSPARSILNRHDTARSLDLTIGPRVPDGCTLQLKLPANWSSTQTDDGFRITAPDKPDSDLYTLGLELNGNPAFDSSIVDYPHIGKRARYFPASAQIRIMDVALPTISIAYIGGGNDRVAYWLRALGLQVTELEDSMLTTQVLERYDTLVVGVFALRTRSALINAMPTVHEWISQGGNLLTLYHRPWDNWDPARVPPRPVKIGKPSLRWRVTDENATVTHLIPDHPLLNVPNVIRPADWEGWHKERGLYFPMQWDDCYQALLSMADPDETPHKGALICAKVGDGRHTHTSLILHHQLEKLVPGAFRLMANLIAAASD